MTAIGISGFASTGKTEIANYLEQQYGYKRLHVAEPLRDMLRALLDCYGIPAIHQERYLTGDWKEDVIPQIGVTSRQLQISLGTEWGRLQVHPDLWANLWRHRAADYPKPMNDSVRFPNEEIAVRARQGFTIMVIRPGTHPVAYRWGSLGRWLYRFGLMWGVHDSERTDRLRPDHVIVNDGTIQDLHRKVDALMKSTTR